MEQYPDAYKKERAERFGVCKKSIWQSMKKMSLTYKKTLLHPKANESDRLVHQQKIQQYEQKDKPVVFIDGSGFSHETLHALTPIPQKVSAVLG